jgi:predicted regulator of Ras-like GTPase activity (Roadblock/LC7/MglB family)
MRNDPAATGPISDELRLIRQNVPGVRGSITATSDGLLVAHDMHGVEPTEIAALVAATHAVAVRASLSAQCGQLKEVITRGSDGYLAVYAAGDAAIVAVLGTTELNVAMLHLQARKVIERIAAHSAALARGPRTGSSGVPGAASAPRGQDHADRGSGSPLPARRPSRK